MVKSQINVSTGANTYENATSSSTMCSSTTTNVTSDCCFATYFTLADLPQSATFTALYDLYRIKEIEVTFSPLCNMNGTQSAALSATMSEYCMYYAVDLDDASVVSPLSALMEYEDVKRHDFLHKGPLVVRFKPRVAMAAYSGAFTSYANTKDQWLDCGSTGIQYYGIKWALPCPVNTTFGIPPVALVVRYLVEFKTVR
jgi:hypothetical protein